MTAVKWPELLEAFEFASFGMPGESRAFVDRDTGTLYFVAEDMEVEHEVPRDLESSDRYLALPHKNDLDLGRKLALAFVDEHLPSDFDAVMGYFRKRGAYSRFKDLLADRGALETWYAFEQEATERALREWCEENDIELLAEPSAEASPEAEAQRPPLADAVQHVVGRQGTELQLLVNIDVDDLDKAIAFYSTGLGLRLERRLFDDTVAELSGASSTIHLLLKPASSSPAPAIRTKRRYGRHWTPIHLDFTVDDIAAAVDRAVRAGATLEGEVQSYAWGRLATLSDPFGHGFCVVQLVGRGYDEVP